MISQEQNERMTRVGPGTPAGNLLRNYWQQLAGGGARADARHQLVLFLANHAIPGTG